MSDVGSSWASTPLETLCDPARGIAYGIVKVGDFVPEGVPVIRGGDIRKNRIVVNHQKRVSSEVSSKFKRTVLQGGEIVINLIAEPGHSAVVPASMAGFNVSRDVAVIPLIGSVNHLFVNYFLQSPQAVRWLTARLQGSVTQKINLGTLRQVPIALPDRTEQDAIAEVLVALDAKIEANWHAIDSGHQLADAHFGAWRDGLSGTSPAKFEDLAGVSGGTTPKTEVAEYWGDGHRWAVPRDVTALAAPYLFDTERHITDAGLASIGNRLHPVGSIFMTSRATIGAFAVPQTPCATNQGFIVVVPKDPLYRWFLFHEMRSRVPDMLDLANGSTFLEVSRGNFKRMQTIRPAVADVERLDALLAPLHAWCASAVAEATRLTECREVLLPRLLSGQVRVRNAEKLIPEAML